MIDIIEKELKAKMIAPIGDDRFVYNGKEMSLVEAKNLFTARIKNNKKIILELWNDVHVYVSNDSKGDSNPYIRRMFIISLQNLHNLACYFQKLHDIGVVDGLHKCLNFDSGRFSSRMMLKVIEFNMGIEWLNHLILRDYYICHLLYKWNFIKSNVKQASGTSGPWSNVDVPMKERAYEWSDIDDEIMGRTRDRQMQARYHMGLEGLGTSRVNEGFHWEELRRYPYDFEDSDNNIYPHRNLLWRS